jgi:hypothetical protein
MGNDRVKRTIWRLLPHIVTAAGIIAGVLEFNTGEDNRRREEAASTRHKDDIDFRRQLWLEKLAVYRSVADLAGKIAATPPGRERDKEVQEFYGAYWGSTVLVDDRTLQQDKDVTAAIMSFRDELRDLDPDDRGLSDRLRIAAEQLAEACHKSLQAGFTDLSSQRSGTGT